MEISEEYKKGILVVSAIAVMIISWIVVLTVPCTYKSENEEEPGSLAKTGYVSLEESGDVRQQIEPNVDSRILLDNIKIILLNLSEGDTGGELHIVIRRDADDKVIREMDYSLDSAVPGEWMEIPVRAMLGMDSYSLEIHASGGATPYLVTQPKGEASSWNIRLWNNGIESEDSLAIIYDYHNVAPVSVRIYICFGIFLLIILLLGRVFHQKIWKKYRAYIMLVILIVLSVPIVWVSIYSRPCVDDFDYSQMTHQLVKLGECSPLSLLYAALRVDKHYYFNWQGLYTSGFLLALQPGIFGEKWYWLGTVALIIFMVVTIYIVTLILRKNLCGNTKYSLSWAVLFTVMILQGIPSPIEGLYWFNGMMNYVPFVFLTLLNIALMIEAEYCGYQKKKVFLIFSSCIVSFIISGGNHVTSFLNIMLLFLIVVARGIRKKYEALAPLLSAIIGFMIMYFAPGTAARQAQFENAGILQTILESGNRCLSDVRQWTNLQWICCVILVLPFACDIIKSNRIKRVRVHPLVGLLLSLVLLTGMRCVPYFAMQEFGAGRVDNVIWVTYIILSMVNVIYFVVWLYCKEQMTLKIDYGEQRIMWTGIILCFLVCISGNHQNGESTSIQAMDELLTGRAQKYAATFDERISLLENVSTDQILYVRPLPESQLLKFDDITGDIDDWRNSAWTKYYGVPTVVGLENE